jgi:hypothetical protein
VSKLTEKAEKINQKLKQLGKPLGINGADAIKAKRTIKNVVAIAIIGIIIGLIGWLISPGGQAGYYYGGGSIRDFHLFFGGFF